MIALRLMGQNRQKLALLHRQQGLGRQGPGLLRGGLEDGGLGEEEKTQSGRKFLFQEGNQARNAEHLAG